MIAVPAGLLPVQDVSTEAVLYGSRKTSYRYELLTHDSVTGVDSLAGFLDGVDPDSARLDWQSAASVKKLVKMSVTDLAIAEAGKTTISQVDLLQARIRPVRIIEGLPETPLGLYLLNASPEMWSGTGRTYDVVMHDKSTVLEQDHIEGSFTAGTDEPILQIVADVIASAGETIAFDGSDTSTLSTPATWEAGTSKLTIVNDLLTKSLSYFALRVDGLGNFRATPYVEPADRSIRYSVLNGKDGKPLLRELRDGEQSIYSPEWTRDRVNYKVPNKVIAISSGVGGGPALRGVATNENPDSPYSYQGRGNRWIGPDSGPLVVDVPDFSGEADPVAATEAFLEAAARRSLIALSSVQSAIEIDCLPIPLELLDAVMFANVPAGIDARHTVRSVTMPLTFDGLMSLKLQEVVSL